MKARGFTLIELMIVIAVLAILVAIGYPSYQRQVEKTRRADAQSALLAAAQGMERCFTRNNSYIGCFTTDTPGDPSPDEFYNVRASVLTATSYTLTATAVGNDDCSPFTLDHRGNRGANPAGTRCWGN